MSLYPWTLARQGVTEGKETAANRAMPPLPVPPLKATVIIATSWDTLPGTALRRRGQEWQLPKAPEGQTMDKQTRSLTSNRNPLSLESMQL